MSRLPAPGRFPPTEAWPGRPRHHHVLDQVHIVDWPRAQNDGQALCGAKLHQVAIYPLGTAETVRTGRCKACERTLANRVPSAPVVPLRSRKRKVTS